MKCKHCGCTDTQACEGGCWWVAPDVCSTCEPADKMLKRMHVGPSTKAASVLKALMDGPATTGELVAELGWTRHDVACHVSALYQREKLSRTVHRRLGRGHVTYLWALKEAA